MKPHEVVVLMVAPVIGYDAVIPSQVFGEATASDGSALYHVRLAALDGALVETTTGYGLMPHGGVELLAEAETVIVPGTRAARNGTALDPRVRAALADIRPGARVMSICTGAFVLAAAGFLDGRPATTHWKYADDLAVSCPGTRVDPAVLYTDDGDLLTSAGLSAGVDLCLHVVRRDHGSEVANRVARHLVVPAWRDGGQAQFIDRPAPPEDGGVGTALTRTWATRHLDEDLSVARLAAHAQMSRRTFVRRFAAETGTSPAAWVTQQRVRLAQELLETTDLPIDEVARRAGLGSGGSLRAHLRAASGVSPSTYRATFRGGASVAG